jgi:hypothetical protein
MENLTKIQRELKVPKGNFNSFGKYKYRSAEDILEAVKPVLANNNARLTISDDIVLLGTKVFIKSTATIKIGDEVLSCSGYAETSEHKGMSAEQTTGTASSYARKYALNGLFLIDETEADADNQNVTNSKPTLDKNSKGFNDVLYYVKNNGDINKVKAKYHLTKEVEDLLNVK